MTKRDSKTLAYLSFWLSIIPYIYIALICLIAIVTNFSVGMLYSFLIFLPAWLLFPWLEILALGCGIKVVASNSQGRAYAFFGIALSTAYLVTAVVLLPKN